MAPHEAAMEAARCIYCHDAPCARACPAAIDVAGFIKKISTGNLTGSARLLLAQNPLAASCARVCPSDKLCASRCVLPDMGIKPIDIARLQRFVMDWSMERDLDLKSLPSTDHRVSVVGAGPAGITCAVELRRRGHAVTVYDDRGRPGGLGTYAIATHKMSSEFAIKEVDWLSTSGFLLRLGTRVGEHVTFKELEDTSDFIFLGVGLSVPRRLEVEGEGLPEVVNSSTLLAAHRRQAPLPVLLEGKRVVVIGGGHAATDSALLATLEQAAEVTIAYRQSQMEMPAYASEVKLVRNRGVELLFLHNPTRILGTSTVEGVELQPMELGEPNKTGRRRPEPRQGAAPILLACDVVILALGHGVDEGLMSRVEGLRVGRRGKIRVDPDTGQTGNPKYFAGGDCVNGGREVVHAVVGGRRAALAIHQALEAEDRER